ncbi:MAG: transcriptional regulator [Actinomycetia bacterium]|nr:transcriptional regulator [Actinomycetes bacterium]
MSVGYVIKLEQGKAGRPSPDLVDRLAETLGINPLQSRHLHDLALYHRVTEHVDAPAEPLVNPVMKEAADNLHPHLCGYLDEMWNILYCNSEYARIYRHIDEVGNVLK